MLLALIASIATRVPARRAAAAPRKAGAVSPTPSPFDLLACLICALAVPIVEWGVFNQETIDEITAEVEQVVCSFVPEEARDICDVYVEDQVPQIVQAIFDGIEEVDICQWLGIC
jgi:hypothetical protein